MSQDDAPDREQHDDGQGADPLGLGAADRQIRINELEEQVKALGDGEMRVAENCPPEIHEQFLRNIVEFESAPKGTPFGRLVRAGVELPPAAEMDNAALHTKLWEVIHALAKMDIYLYHTDHLSDRELYEHLWTDSLREVGAIMAPGSGWSHIIDLIGSGSEESIQIALRYYDSEEDRQRWAREWPRYPIPPHEDPPCDRDRLLPKEPPPAPPVDIDYDDFFDDAGPDPDSQNDEPRSSSP